MGEWHLNFCAIYILCHITCFHDVVHPYWSEGHICVLLPWETICGLALYSGPLNFSALWIKDEKIQRTWVQGYNYVGWRTGLYTMYGSVKYVDVCLPTLYTQWVQFIFFFLCFFTDIMPRSYFKGKFQQACDLLFTTVAIPLSFVSTCNYMASNANGGQAPKTIRIQVWCLK